MVINPNRKKEHVTKCHARPRESSCKHGIKFHIQLNGCKLFKDFAESRNEGWVRTAVPPVVCLSLRFQVLTAASMNMTAFWDIVSCSLVEVGMFQ
jgi:hypothetical protein